MGQPKQLLTIGNQTLLHRTVDTALRSQATSITIVLGAAFDACVNALQDIQNPKLTLLQNPHYPSGLASSIHCGVNHLIQRQTAIDAVIISVCDQPNLTSEIFNQLMQSNSNQPIVASGYADTIGVPALFDRTVLPELLKLKGDRGARHLIQQYQQQGKIDVIPFAAGAIDLDTIEDYRAFLDGQSPQFSNTQIPSTAAIAPPTDRPLTAFP